MYVTPLQTDIIMWTIVIMRLLFRLFKVNPLFDQLIIETMDNLSLIVGPASPVPT
jgi:hypothetical protein